MAPGARALADLLRQLALGGLERALALRVELAGRQLEQACSPTASRGWRTRKMRSPSWATTATAPGCETTLAIGLARRRRSGCGPRARWRSRPPRPSLLSMRSKLIAALAATIASVRSSIVSSASTVTDSSGWWLRSVPLATLSTGRPAAISALASLPPPVVDVDRLDADRPRAPRRPISTAGAVRGELVAAEQALDGGLDVALEVARGLGERVHHRADHLAGARVVEAARLEHDLAALGHHVRGGAALDLADVGGGRVVEPAELDRRDRPRGGDDRVVARLGADPGVGGLAAEVGLEPVVGGRRDHELADRRGVVEHEAELRAQARRGRTPSRRASASSSQVVKSSSTPTGAPSAHEPPGGSEDRGDGGLVVGAEDRLVAVARARRSPA